MEINEDIYQWLTSAKIIPQVGTPSEEFADRIILPKNITQALENGILFGKIAQYYNQLIQLNDKNHTVNIDSQLKNLKEINTPACKIANWNLLSDVYRKLHINLDADIKALVISGDYEMMHEILKEVYANVYTYLPVGQVENFNLESIKKDKKNLPQLNYQNNLNLHKLDMKKDIYKTRSLLELLIVTLGRHLNLQAEQTATLFTNQGKYLAYLLAKGVKSIFDPIINFYQDLYTGSNHIIRLIQEDQTQKQFFFFMNTIKPGLISKSLQVSQWCSRLISKISFEISQTNLYKQGWDWMCGESNGLNMIMLGLKRHNEIQSYVVSILLQFGKLNLQETFTNQLQKALPEVNDFLNIIQILLSSLVSNENVKQELIQSGVIEEWLVIAIECGQQDYSERKDTKVKGIIVMVDLWLQFQALVENSQQQTQIIDCLNKCTKDTCTNIILIGIQQLFRLLDDFSQNKNVYARVIYKTLTLSLIENHQKVQVRQMILNNFIQLYTNIQSMPLEILVEPLIRQIQVTEQETYKLNIPDFEFLEYISKNERLTENLAIRIMDLLAKVYLNNLVYSQISGIIIMNLLQRFYQQPNMSEFVMKFIKIALAMYYASERLRKPKDKVNPNYNTKQTSNKNANQQELDLEILQSQKRALIIQIIYQVVQLNDNVLNDQIKKVTAHTNIQIKQFQKNKKDNKGMMYILEYFGDPAQVMQKCEQEFLQHQEELKKQNVETSLASYDQFNQSTIDATNLTQRNDSVRAIQENMRKYQNENNQTILTNNELKNLAQLRNPQIQSEYDKRNIENLKQVQKNFQSKQKKQEDQKNGQNIKDEQLKKQIKQTIDKRNVEYGYAPMLQKDYQQLEGVMIFEFNARLRANVLENKSGLVSLPFINLQEEENIDEINIKNALKKYKKFFQNVFNKYSGCHYNTTKQQKIQSEFDSKKVLSLSESYAFTKDFGFDQNYNLKQHEVMIKNICLFLQKQQKKALPEEQSNEEYLLEPPKKKPELYYTHDKTIKKETIVLDLKNIDYHGFKVFLVQLANIAYIMKNPEIQLSQGFDLLIDKCRSLCLKNKQWNMNYLWQDSVNGVMLGDGDTIQILNRELEKDPEFELPKGYKKVPKQIVVPKIPTEESRFQSYFNVMEILEDIFTAADKRLCDKNKSYLDRINVKFVEKSYELKNKFEAQFSLKDQVESKPTNLIGIFQDDEKETAKEKQMKLYNKRHYEKGSEFDFIPETEFDKTKKQKYGDKKVLDVNFHRPKRPIEKICNNLKIGISTFPMKERFIAEEVAFVIEDMVISIENMDKPYLKYNKEKIINYTLAERNKKLEEEKLKEELRLKQIQKHQQYLKSDKFKEENGVKEKEKEQKQLQQKEKQEKEAQKQKQKDEAERKRKQEIAKKVQENQQKIDDEKQKLKDSNEEEKKKREVLKQQENKQAIAERTLKYMQDINKINEQKQNQQNDKEKEELQRQVVKESVKNKVFKIGKQRKEEEKQTNIMIQAQHYSPEIQEVYKQHEFKLKTLFSYLKDNTYHQIGKTTTKSQIYNPPVKSIQFKTADIHGNDDEISSKVFSWFCFNFRIFPEVLNPQDIYLIYRSLTNPKQWLLDNLDNKEAIENSTLFQQSGQKTEQLNQSALVQSQALLNKSKSKANYTMQMSRFYDNKTGTIGRKEMVDGYYEDVQIGINYQEFLEGLTRIAIKGQKIFNQMALHLNEESEVEQLSQQDIENTLDQEMEHRLNNKPKYENYLDKDNFDWRAKMKEEREKKQQENIDKPDNIKKTLVNSNFIVDKYEKLEEVTAQTIECLILYLRLPNSKLGIVEVFKQALENSKKQYNKKQRLKSNFKILLVLEEKLKQDPQNFVYNNKRKKGKGKKGDNIDTESKQEEEKNGQDDKKEEEGENNDNNDNNEENKEENKEENEQKAE